MGSLIQGPTEFKLNNGTVIPAVGLGTWQAEKGLVGEAVKVAIEVGYRHIDCASIYGNQKEIGAALEEVFKSGLVKRSDLWITSKLWCTDHDPEEVPKALEQTLQDLGLEYIDLYLIHWPVHLRKGAKSFKDGDFAPLDIPATWAAMEKLVEAGKTKSIGVSNFSCKKLEDLLTKCKIVPAVNQVECSPTWQQEKLRSYCNTKGIHLTAYSPFGSTGASVLKNPVVNEVAQNLGKEASKVALRWLLQTGVSVLPKSTKAERLKTNLEIFDFSIPDEEYKQFTKIEQKRLLTGNFCLHPSSPYKSLDELWDGEN